MSSQNALVGRDSEREALLSAAERALLGRGSLVFLAGEAGVGKTRLTEMLASEAKATTLYGRANQSAPSPYGPITAALRSYLRLDATAFDGIGPLRRQLAQLLPELGSPPTEPADAATMAEAVACAVSSVAGDVAAIVVVDDCQWADDATLDLLPALAEAVAARQILVVATYRTDGLPRDHELRRIRHELRRAGHLQELVLEPLAADAATGLLAEALGSKPSPALAAAVTDRTRCIPFFIEELGAALIASNALSRGPRGLELSSDAAVPLPDTVRDAVLIGIAELSPLGRDAAEVAATAGDEFDLSIAADMADPAGIGELIEAGWISETDPGRAAFRHALAREAIYSTIPWLRRRELHRGFAQRLEAAGAAPAELASHWLGAREDERARVALLAAAAQARAMHAHRDAARAAGQALELWPADTDVDSRVEALDAFATSAELSGQLAEAAKAGREICGIRADQGSPGPLAEAERRLARISDLRNDRQAALSARRAAAEAFVEAGMIAEAAAERLVVAAYLRGKADYSEAIAEAERAIREAEEAERIDLRARAMGLCGVAMAKRGDFDEGLETVERGLALALENGMTPVAAELYQRLSLVLYDSADYRRAETALDTALELCGIDGSAGTEIACVTCMIYVLRERGEWGEATRMGRELIERGNDAWTAEGLLGTISAFQGRLSSARRLLSSSLGTSSRLSHFNMTVDSTAGLAWIAAAEGAGEEAAGHCHAILNRWRESEDHHYAIRGLRWSTMFFARRGELAEAHACADALIQIAGTTGHADALAALAHAIGETALAEGDVDVAADQLVRAAELHRGLDMPYERAEIEVRAGVVLAAAGSRDAALERLTNAHRIARRLGARPLATEAAREVAALGESVAARLGSRAGDQLDGEGLTRREVEVVRLLASGQTNKEIARDLFLSPRTIDMHVRNILRKLDCRSRLEASQRAAALGLLEVAQIGESPHAEG